MIKLIIRAFKRFAWFKRLNAKVTYELLAKRISAEDWQFMNYGYIPNESEPPASLPDDPKIQKYPMQMYHYLAAKAPIKGKNVLEVGSGRGGGGFGGRGGLVIACGSSQQALRDCGRPSPSAARSYSKSSDLFFSPRFQHVLGDCKRRVGRGDPAVDGVVEDHLSDLLSGDAVAQRRV